MRSPGHFGENGCAYDIVSNRYKYLIYYLAGGLPDEERSFIERVILESFNISIITRIELLGWKGAHS